ncbi:phage portal protein [Salmonella enterica subsp. enterica serovar Bovismorbificans]|nr:phage portal protein [Salmonella enterica subsp. enterica serovar Bovismorbificans]
MFNFFRNKKTVEQPIKKIGIRQHRKVFVEKKVEEYTRNLQKRSLGLSTHDRLEGDMATQVITGSINSVLKGSAKRLSDQGRTLALNSSIGARYVQLTIDSVIGTGLNPKTFIMKGEELDVAKNSEIEKVFWRWASSQKRFARNGRFNFVECLKLMEKDRIMTGDSFLVLDKSGKDLQVTLYDGEYVDWADTRKLDNGNVVYGGIEIDPETERPVAYWFRRRDYFTQSFTGEKFRVEAERVLHYYIPATSGAIRGCTDFVPVIKDIAHYDAWRETSLILKRVAASSMGFLERPKEENDSFDVDDEEGNNWQAPDIITDFSPGTINELPPGYQIKSIQSNQSGDDFSKFSESVMTSIGMGLSVYTTALTGDTSNVNYSAARFGDNVQKLRFKAHQDRIIDTVILPLFEAFLTHAVLNSRINVRLTQIEDIILNTVVIRPKQESVDPIKDINAEVAMISAGLKSKSSVIMAMGSDPVQVFKEIEAEKSTLNTSEASDAEKDKPAETQEE